MKINNINGQYLNTNTQKPKENQHKSNDIKVDKLVSVQISDSAKELVKEIEGSNDAKFSEKVEKIRQLILDGNYKVSSEAIAGKMLEVIEIQKGREV